LHPQPPSKRSRKWKVLRSILLSLVALLATGLLWQQLKTMQAKRHFLEKLSSLQQAGEPVTRDDFERQPPLPDDQNAAIPLLRAAARLPEYDEKLSRESSRYPFRVPLSQREHELLAPELAVADAILADVREAQARPAVRWPRDPNESMLIQLLPELNPMRSLATAIDHAAVVCLDRGDFKGALDRLRLALSVADALSEDQGFVGFLVSVGVRHQVLARLEEVLAKMGDPKDGPPQLDPQILKDWIKLLSDERKMNRAAVRAAAMDRASVLESFENLLELRPLTKNGETPSRMGVWIARDKIWNASSLALDYWGGVAGAFSSPDYPSAVAALPPVPETQTGDIGTKLLATVAPSIRRLPEQHFQIIAQYRLALTAVAIRAYAADHQGARPATLAELVPAYLPAVPLDPMARSSALKYVAGPESPRVYSIGRNGVDDGGQEPDEVLGLARTPSGKSSFDFGDLVFKLAPRPRPEVTPADPGDEGPAGQDVPPATQPATRRAEECDGRRD
jgi:hypothetical protein